MAVPPGRVAPSAAVLIDFYDTLVHARPDGRFYHVVPTALGVDRDPWLACYRDLGRADADLCRDLDGAVRVLPANGAG